MSRRTLNLDAAPAWDYAVEIRGAVVPLLSPRQTPERTVVRPDIGARRKAGLVVGVARLLRRWLWAAPTPSRPTDEQETEAVRELCLAFTPAHHHDVIRQLNGGELLDLFMTYRGFQQEHLDRVQRWAASARQEPGSPDVGDVIGRVGMRAPADPAQQGTQRVNYQPTPLRPGDALPSWMGGGATGRNAEPPSTGEQATVKEN